MKEIGIHPDRIEMVFLGASEAAENIEHQIKFLERIKELGPLEKPSQDMISKLKDAAKAEG